MTASQTPTGLARRGRRLTDQETEQRMLAAAVGLISSSGLTVSLDHISLEDVIRAADVARSTVYRRWPHKDLFFSDLVRELARTATPALLAQEQELIGQIVAERPDWLDTAGLREQFVAELFRRLALLDVETLAASPAWRTYVALHAAVMSLTDTGLRRQLQAALGRSEREHLAHVAAAWEYLTGLLGYRLRPGLGATFPDLVALVDATMRGSIMMAFALPELASQRTRAPHFAGPGRAGWSLPAVGVASIAWTFLEPDPAITWDQERVAAVRQQLANLTLPPG
jgi:AcrR family transcriptional regulator